jgi:hypothetical protein
MRRAGRLRDLPARSLLLLGWLVVILLVDPRGDFPLNDDWAYAWSARHLATTGELRILDWAAPSLVSHLAWGAALVRLLGPSYTVLRLGTLAWAFVGLLALHALWRRTTDADPATPLLGTLAVGLSPWWVNLSFTYMTDVPWTVFTLCAMLALIAAPRGPAARPGLLLLAGTLLGLAALCRQFAVILAPAFVLLIAFDARHAARAAGSRWWRTAAWRSLLFLVPLLLLYGAFSSWYAHVHGTTQAYREALQRMRHMHPALPFLHALAVWHYVGLWTLPLVAALAGAGRLRGLVSRRQALLSAVLLVGYGVFAWCETHFGAEPALGINAHRPPTMPYLGNVVYLLGAGPPTLNDTYYQAAYFPHHPAWFGYVLSLLSTVGGIYAGGLLRRAVSPLGRLLWPSKPANAAPPPTETDIPHQRDRLRLLFLGSAALYLGWNLTTSPHLFDRYLLPVMPAALWLVADALPCSAGRSKAAFGLVLLIGLFSVGATHQYLSWNAARDRAVRALAAQGIADSEVDGGFEVNGPRHFATYFRRTGQLLAPRPTPWWVPGARYHIVFRPESRPDCRPLAGQPPSSWPYWSWPGTGPRALYILDCGAPLRARSAHSAGTSTTATSTQVTSPRIASRPNDDRIRLSAVSSDP